MCRSRSALVVGLIAITSAGGTLVAAPARYDGTNRHVIDRLDGVPVVTVNPLDGTTWSAWAYRSGGEFDLAVASREAGGEWSAPSFFGSGDRANQGEPALVVDDAGTVFLAYADGRTGHVEVLALRSGAGTWTPVGTIVATASSAARRPTMVVVGDRLVVAYADGAQVGIETYPRSVASPLGIQDGPDPFGNRNVPGSPGGSGTQLPQPNH